MKMRSALYLASVAGALFCTTFAGCTTTAAEVKTQLVPRSLSEVEDDSEARTSKERPRVALVLGGGGLRGFAHVGVLRALEDVGIKPDLVVGTSAGAVVGAAYASGLSADEVERVAQTIEPASLIDFTLSKSGLMRGANIAAWVDTVTRHIPIEQFPIRFAAIATDLENERPVALMVGSSGQAVQASAAVPGINVPVSFEGGHLVDGGSTSLVPVRFAKAMGAEFIIAVDIYCDEAAVQGLSAVTVVYRVMRTQSCQIARSEMAEADVVIRPRVASPGLAKKGEYANAAEAGYAAARSALAQISLGRQKL
ncbi:patatin-like phospholipase family protein [Ideonella sp. YS5]|uniref:patatin-like phospholipase family protein n=1 Tax=Ideonella sp. YS5 TaxID=3453714 RepID=UPI003EECDE61